MSVDTNTNKDLYKLELPKIKEKYTSKKILEDKSNCENTIKRFYNEDEEKVRNLNFFDPYVFTMENKDIVRSTSYGLFNINSSKSKLQNRKNRKSQVNIGSSSVNINQKANEGNK